MTAKTAADLARALGLPVVLVVGMQLGCLNHALLTAQAVRAAGLALAGWVANRIDPQMDAFDENVLALEQRLNCPLLGVLPFEPGANAKKMSGLLSVAADGTRVVFINVNLITVRLMHLRDCFIKRSLH